MDQRGFDVIRTTMMRSVEIRKGSYQHLVKCELLPEFTQERRERLENYIEGVNDTLKAVSTAYGLMFEEFSVE